MPVAFESSPATAIPGRIDPQVVTTVVVACDGGNGPLGHPRVYLTLGHDREATCPYCSRHFVLAEGVTAGGH